MKKVIIVMLLCLTFLSGCVPEGDLTGLLHDLENPNMKPVYSELHGKWIAVPKEEFYD